MLTITRWVYNLKFDENLVLVAWLYKHTISFIHICMRSLRTVSSLYCTNLSCTQDSDGSGGIGLSADGRDGSHSKTLS